MSAPQVARPVRVEPGGGSVGSVGGASTGYDVWVEDGVLDRLGTYLHPGRRVLVVTQPGRGHEACQIGHSASAKTDHQVVTGEPCLPELLPQPGQDAHVLGGLGIRDTSHVGHRAG